MNLQVMKAPTERAFLNKSQKVKQQFHDSGYSCMFEFLMKGLKG